MLRMFDVIAVIAVAVVVLLPRPSVNAHPALIGEPVELDRVARLQDDLFRNPTDVAAAVGLADSLLSFFRSDWAIATLTPFAERERRGLAPLDARVHLLLATSRAERLETELTVAEAELIRAVCAAREGGPACPAGTLARAHVITGAMKVLVDEGIDPRREPRRARDAVHRFLRTTRPGF